jgi:transcriptional regulator with XRE-family HTH domain/Zn-dependent peptidase ImmA (M78 family)
MSQLLGFSPRILGMRIADARKASGKTQEEVARVLGISRPTYIAIEKGERKPKSEEIIRIASLFDRKMNDLLRQIEPATELKDGILAALDLFPDPEKGKFLPAIVDFQRWVEDYEEILMLTKGCNQCQLPVEIRLNPGIDPEEFGEDLAAQERQRLGLGNSSIDSVFQVLEARLGITIFPTEKLPATVGALFSHSAKIGCCLVVNIHHSVERRQGCVLHAYGQWLVNRFQSGVVRIDRDAGRRSSLERFVQAFATSFLMPAAAVRTEFRSIIGATKRFMVADLKQMSDQFKVSVQEMALRMETLGLVPRGSWEQVCAGHRLTEMNAKETKSMAEGISDNLPARYKLRAVQAYDMELIGDSKLAEYLRTDMVISRGIANALKLSWEMKNTVRQEPVELNSGHSILITAY